ncbi:MAG: ABC transporter permease [Chloroflexi bacterium]|uniref:ABC transporter permease n=1 Tax=Candidatus Flexifilum breve TaxID=3140694 RepID=UPI003135C316|nr:ABC transporter permease [Chloroflexota bacterium]
MYQYLLRRTLIAIGLVFTIMAVVFIMLRVALPGDPAVVLAGDRASPELIAQIRENLGLDRPILEQLALFMVRAVQGDLGRSVKFGEPVFGVILKAFPFTLLLTFLSVGIGTAIGLGVGVLTAVKHGTWIDKVSIVFVVFFYSIPTFWLGTMLILLFAVAWRLLPVQGAETWEHFVLPVTTLSIGEAAFIARLTRANMLEALSAPYVQTARSKGLVERRVVFVHALRNTLIPVITVVGLSMGSLLGGAVITESIFGLPGVGRLSIQAILDRDYPMIQGTVLLVAVAFVFVNLLVDVIYTYIDPRIRFN